MPQTRSAQIKPSHWIGFVPRNQIRSVLCHKIAFLPGDQIMPWIRSDSCQETGLCNTLDRICATRWDRIYAVRLDCATTSDQFYAMRSDLCQELGSCHGSDLCHTIGSCHGPAPIVPREHTSLRALAQGEDTPKRLPRGGGDSLTSSSPAPAAAAPSPFPPAPPEPSVPSPAPPSPALPS